MNIHITREEKRLHYNIIIVAVVFMCQVKCNKRRVFRVVSTATVATVRVCIIVSTIYIYIYIVCIPTYYFMI